MKEWLISVIKMVGQTALVVAGIYLSLFLISSWLGPLKFSFNTKNLDQKNLFTVDGEGKVTVKPDLAVISLGVMVQDPSVTNGQKQANQIINRLTEALKSLGIADKDIETTSYNIYPNYNFNDGRQSLNGYNINIGLSIKVRNFETLNQVIDRATQLGINQVGGISFDVENKEKFKDQARQAAVTAAREKAQRLAGLAGLKLGRIVNLREAVPNVVPRPLVAFSGEKGMGGGETQVQPGSTEVVVDVSLDYETL